MGENIKSPILVFDYDYILYRAGFACENRFIEVVHMASGKKKQFKNKTEFYGLKKDVIEGWLGDVNKDRLERGLKPFQRDEFVLNTIRRAEPVENTLHTVKKMIQDVNQHLSSKGYYGYIGKGDTFRKDISTILEYKGQRTEDTRPLLKDEIAQYLHNVHKGKYATQFEADDHVVMDCYKKKDHVLVSVDKDAMGTGCLVYNPDHPEQGIVDTNCFGKIWLNEKGDVKGYGRKFFYYQWIYGDNVDNYFAHAASDAKWGSKSAYNALVDCESDVECFECALNVYKALYPEEKTIEGWRGDDIVIDHLYVADEIWQLARMLRHPNDNVLATDVWRKYGMIE